MQAANTSEWPYVTRWSVIYISAELPNVAHQPRRGPRAAGCMRLFGDR
jgi:hypothetical protein